MANIGAPTRRASIKMDGSPGELIHRRSRNVLRGLSRSLLLIVAATHLAGAQQCDAHASLKPVVGEVLQYTTVQGDTLARISSRFGVTPATLASNNPGVDLAHLALAQNITIDPRHVVPECLDNGIVINIPQRMLFLFRHGEVIRQFPVGLGRRDWPTPTGNFQVIQKEINPAWNVPESIQQEMRGLHKQVRRRVPPGPANPLGIYFVRISSGCGIHGTIEPASIYRFQTHGCIRLQPAAIAELFPMVNIGEIVSIVYEPLLLGRDQRGSLYLEINADIYRRRGPYDPLVHELAAEAGVADSLDWNTIKRILRLKETTSPIYRGIEPKDGVRLTL